MRYKMCIRDSAYTEAFLDMKQEAWITGHVNAYRYFGGVTRILTRCV